MCDFDDIKHLRFPNMSEDIGLDFHLLIHNLLFSCLIAPSRYHLNHSQVYPSKTPERP
jgi:hypothetical protein